MISTLTAKAFVNLDLDEIPIEQASEVFRDPKKDVLKNEDSQ